MFKSIKPKKPNKALLIKENSETDETYVIISKLLKKYKKAQKEVFFFQSAPELLGHWKFDLFLFFLFLSIIECCSSGAHFHLK